MRCDFIRKFHKLRREAENSINSTYTLTGCFTKVDFGTRLGLLLPTELS